jgi:hypothetical protein
VARRNRKKKTRRFAGALFKQREALFCSSREHRLYQNSEKTRRFAGALFQQA